MLQASTLRFLKELKKNNNKPWFDLHRREYETAKTDFASFVQQLIGLHGKKDPGIRNLQAKDCMFRINRDIRFSKDKSPYKTNFGASINQGGKKAWNSAGYYFHLEPGNSFVGGGIYMPEPAVLAKVRQEIDYNLPAFNKMISSSKFRSVYGSLSRDPEYMLSRVPKGYEPSNPAAEFLKLKSFIAMTKIPDKGLTGKDMVKKAAAAFEALQPLIRFINEAVS